MTKDERGWVITEHGIPRRSRVDLWTPAERAIGDAMAAVEGVGAHPVLTAALNLLIQAKEALADYVDMNTDVEG